ncbi:unnamed protein product [Ostreobium quekettii]|uniref:Prolyl 4-hydroxylase alpha subunit domain-containing protein n=1 Tax=Ostreobium quekettii TaxID=121088 RepID=A0A8S1J5E2_9CHLO|nr:unnamed protein product [Ostreobium quekettii]
MDGDVIGLRWPDVTWTIWRFAGVLACLRPFLWPYRTEGATVARGLCGAQWFAELVTSARWLPARWRTRGSVGLISGGWGPVLQVCSRLFRKRVSSPLQLKRLGIINVEEFKQHGYLVIDNFIPKEVAIAIREETCRLKQKGRMLEASKINPKARDKNARGDYIMWLHLGQPPLDTDVFAEVVVALQELQEDLQEFVGLQNNVVEYQLSHYPGNGAQYVKHRDAFPDDGSDTHQRRVTAIVYTNADWKPEDGGALRLWPPCKNARMNHAAHLEHRRHSLEAINMDTHANGVPHTPSHYGARGPGDIALPSSPAAQRALRLGAVDGHFSSPTDRRTLAPAVQPDRSSPRPPHSGEQPPVGTASEGDIVSISELSEFGSLRSDGLDHVGVPKSTTSSVMAEVGFQDGTYDLSSVGDDMSVASRDHDQPRAGLDWVEVGGEMALEVAPQAGRAVLFLSGAVDHCVMPSHVGRVAITAWFK